MQSVFLGWNTLHDFCPDFPPIYIQEKSTIVAKSQSQSGVDRLHRKSCSV